MCGNDISRRLQYRHRSATLDVTAKMSSSGQSDVCCNMFAIEVEGASYQAHGDSSVYGPFGEKLNDKELEEKPGIVYADLDFTQIEKRRSAMPLNKQRRLSETYELLKKDV